MSAPEVAVVLARGLGTRMRAQGQADLSPDQASAAASGAKALMPIEGRPFLDYSISGLADAGVRDVVIVVPPDHDGFRAHFDEVAPRRVRILYAVQAEPLGTADAIAAAEDAVAGRRFIMVNGDNLYPRAAYDALALSEGCAVVGFDKASLIADSNIPADRIAKFALIGEEDGVLARLVEKPDADDVDAAGPHSLVSMNAMAFTPVVFDACRSIGPSPRGEYEIVDAVRWIAEREPVAVPRVCDGVLDMSSRADVAAVQARLAGMRVTL